MLPISPHESADLSTSIANADVILCQAFGVHGSAWTTTRTSGGDNAAPTEQEVATIELYVVNTRDYVISLSASETEVPDAQWRYLAPGRPQRPLIEGGPTVSVIDEGYVATAVDGARVLLRTVAFDGHHTVGIAEFLNDI